MKVITLDKDFYDKIYDKVYAINNNIYNQYLDEVTEEEREYPFITLKTNINNKNIGTQFISHRTGVIRLVIYDTDFESLMTLYSTIFTALEVRDEEIYIREFNGDSDMLELDGKKPYFKTLDIGVDIHVNNN